MGYRSLIPVDAWRMNDEFLNMHTLTGEENLQFARNARVLDNLLLNQNATSYLFVGCPVRFRGLRDGLGETPKKVSIDEERLKNKLAIVRCHPLEFAGTTFGTQDGDYSITRDLRIKGIREIEGAKLKLAGAIPSSDWTLANIMLTDRAAWERFIEDYSRPIREDMHLVLSLTEEEALRTGRNGLLTAKITRISDY